jgi:IS5 family transposase
VDTTAMEKHVAYPTDASLLQRGRVRVTKLVKALGRLGVSLPSGVRSFVRVSQKAIVTMAKLGRGRKERIAQGTKTLLSCANRTLRRVSRTLSNARTRLVRLKKTGGHREHRTLRRLVERLREEARVLGQVVDQTRKRWKGEATPGRVYSVHEPHIACITKNKAGKKHEYGIKVSLSVDAQGFVVDHAEYADNRHDSTTLADALEGWEEATGTLPRKLTADRGYRAKQGKAPALLD